MNFVGFGFPNILPKKNLEIKKDIIKPREFSSSNIITIDKILNTKSSEIIKVPEMEQGVNVFRHINKKIKKKSKLR